MALFSLNKVALRGVSATVPAAIAGNRHLAGFSESELEKLISAIGIEKRRVAPAAQCASDLCVDAASRLLGDLGWQAHDVELLVFVTQTPDYVLPGTASQIAVRLGAGESCLTFDINQGCAGYVYGCSFIAAMMQASGLKRGLLLVGDTITRLIHPNDKTLVPLFSDAGTATAFELTNGSDELSFNFSTFGKDYAAIRVPEGGARQAIHTTADSRSQSIPGNYLSMKGLEVFSFSISKVVPNVQALLKQTGTAARDLDCAVFHQANALILDTLARKLELPAHKVPSSLKDYGNTSGASIPLTLAASVGTNGQLPNGAYLLCGFGVGLTVASAIVRFKNVICSGVNEL